MIEELTGPAGPNVVSSKMNVAGAVIVPWRSIRDDQFAVGLKTMPVGEVAATSSPGLVAFPEWSRCTACCCW